MALVTLLLRACACPAAVRPGPALPDPTRTRCAPARCRRTRIVASARRSTSSSMPVVVGRDERRRATRRLGPFAPRALTEHEPSRRAPAEVLGRAQRALEPGAAHLERVRPAEHGGRVGARRGPARAACGRGGDRVEVDAAPSRSHEDPQRPGAPAPRSARRRRVEQPRAARGRDRPRCPRPRLASVIASSILSPAPCAVATTPDRSDPVTRKNVGTKPTSPAAGASSHATDRTGTNRYAETGRGAHPVPVGQTPKTSCSSIGTGASSCS